MLTCLSEKVQDIPIELAQRHDQLYQVSVGRLSDKGVECSKSQGSVYHCCDALHTHDKCVAAASTK